MVDDVRFFVAPLVASIIHSFWVVTLIAGLFVSVRPMFRSATSEYAWSCICLWMSLAAFVGVFVHGCMDPYVRSDWLPGHTRPDVWPDYVAMAWVAGVGLSSMRFGGGWLWLRLVVVRRSAPASPELSRIFEELRAVLAAPSPATLRVCSNIVVPMATGILRPVVLLPASMVTGAPEQIIRVAIIHELVHVRRFDHIAVLLQAVGESILFFHPVYLWMSAEARRLREFRCDEESVSILGSKHVYARALLALEEGRRLTCAPIVSMSEGELMIRVKRMFESAPKMRRRGMGGVAIVLGLAVCGVLYSVSFSGDATAGSAAASDDHELSIRWLPDSIMRWRAEISNAATEHQVPADVLAVMMLLESNGRPDAVSPMGAQGLMQVMPTTAQNIAASRGMEDFDVGSLTNPSVNVDFAAWYLRQQIERFEDVSAGDPMLLAVSAYNAGPRAVNAFLDGTAELPEETKRYQAAFASLWAERDLEASTQLTK